MAWPFTTVNQPNLDTGPGQAVPTVQTAITGAQAWLLGAHFTNPLATGLTITVTATDTAGEALLTLAIPAGGEQPFERPFRPALGVKWGADAGRLLGQPCDYA